MVNTNFKISFLLKKDLIENFIKYLQDNEFQVFPNTSEYQRIKGTVASNLLIIYKSGIVIYQSGMGSDSIIQEFFVRNQYSIPEFEKFIDNVDPIKSHYKNTKNNEERGWKEVPKSIWLSELQKEKLIAYLMQNDQFKYQIPASNRELMRFKYNNGFLVLNKNSTVYTIGGFEGYKQLLTKIIELQPLFKGYDLIINFEVLGLKSQIGPIIVACIALTPEEIGNLQLTGVKHRSIGRIKTYIDMAETITKTTRNYSLYMIKPESINEIWNKNVINDDSLNNYEVMGYIHTLHDVLNKISQGKTSNKLLIIINKKIWDIVKTKINQIFRYSIEIQFPNLIQKIQANTGAASILAEIELDKWKRKKEQILNIKIQKNNLAKILQLKNANELVKYQFTVSKS